MDIKKEKFIVEASLKEDEYDVYEIEPLAIEDWE
jgi:hypothetical protein